MHQPAALQTDEYLPWSRGRGCDVWGMLSACARGDQPAVEALLAQDPALVDCEYQYYRPLHFAVRENHVELVRYLFSRGVDPFCGGLGFCPVYKPGGVGNLPWVLDTSRVRGFTEMLDLLETTFRERFHIEPDGEILAALIRNRDQAGVQATLAARPELLDRADGFGNQPLHWAVMTRQTALIDYLLGLGADINAVRPDGAQPIDLTNGDYWYRGWRDLPPEAIRRHEVILGYLLARGAYYDTSTAAQLGDLERVRTLVDEDPHRVNDLPASTGYYNGVPLRCAAGGGHLAVVKFLLERGADPNRPEPVTPQGGALYDAIAGRHWEIVRLLVEHGADASAAVESSGNCFWRAKNENAPREIIELLAAQGGGSNVELACYNGDLELIATMLQANPALLIQEHLPVDNEPLVDLVRRVQPDVLRGKPFEGAKSVERARWLLEQGMDAVSPNWLEITPLHRFAQAGKTDMAELCLEFGAQIDAMDDEFCSTPLGWAARAGETAMVEWLLARGADRSLPDDKPWAQPLAWAERGGHAEVAAMLRT